MNESHSLILAKLSERQLRENVIEKNRAAVVASVNNKTLTQSGWTISVDTDTHANGWSQESYDGNGGMSKSAVKYKFFYYLKITFEHDERKPDKNVLGAMCKKVNTVSAQPGQGRWVLETVDGSEYIPPEEGTGYSADLVGYSELTEIPEDWDNFFDDLYGLESHILRVRRALESGIMSNWTNRLHVGLYGPPACGKSAICERVKKALGEDNVMEYDATATTGAGAIKNLAEREILPRVIVIEEIEKADEKALDFLLAVMDQRAEIRKVTARETIERSTKLFVIATINNLDQFKKMRAGALASRFANKVKFNRPTRELIEMILQREVAKVNGDFAWIEPTLDYCEAKGLNDPREAIAICLTGREMLVTGEYQNILDETSEYGSDVDDWTM